MKGLFTLEERSFLVLSLFHTEGCSRITHLNAPLSEAMVAGSGTLHFLDGEVFLESMTK